MNIHIRTGIEQNSENKTVNWRIHTFKQCTIYMHYDILFFGGGGDKNISLNNKNHQSFNL